SGAAEQSLPTLAMLRASREELQERARKMMSALEGCPTKVVIGEGKAQLGGGTLPRSVIPSVTLEFQPLTISLTDLAPRLRSGIPPVVGYIAGGRFKLDLRTILPQQDQALVQAVTEAFKKE